MQVVESYQTAGEISEEQQFRLFHLARPSVAKWRAAINGRPYTLDSVDQWIVDNIKYKNITVVDFAGWYLELFGYKTTCLESEHFAKQYWPNCYVESDIFVHRPTYISESDPVIFKYPGFLRYITVDQFVAFLDLWCKSTIVLYFDPILVKHNYLKFNLIDLVSDKTQLNIKQINKELWSINV